VVSLTVTVEAANRSPALTPASALNTQLRAQIRGRSSGNFEKLLKDWEHRYGTQAVSPLLAIASDRTAPDSERYVALMGATKLGGRETAPVVTRYLNDRSWMIRAAALRALSALKHPGTAAAVLPLLKDRALVVRLEAVEAVRALRPLGAADALIETLEHSANYHDGKAQWVPQKALNALVDLGAKDVAPRLRPLLDHQKDPELQKEAIHALNALTGRTLNAKEWKLALQSPKQP
jgi:HEAT repeat protein